MSWQSVKLESVAQLDRDSVHPNDADANTPYIGLEHIGSDGQLDSIETVSSAELKSNKFRFSTEHVLFGKLRPYLCKIARPDFSGVCSTDIIPLRPSTKLDRNYLYHFLRTPAMVDFATSRCSGANLPRLSPKQLAAFQIPLPPLAEQKRIAGILDAADALRAKRRESIEQLDTLILSTFLEMFGDPVTNPKGWDKRTIGDCVESIDSGWSPKCLDRPAGESEWGVLKLGSVTWCMFDESQQKALPKHDSPRPHLEVKNGDLLFSRKNTHDLVAAAAYVNSVRPKLMLPDLVFRLRLKADSGIDPIFLWAQLTEPRQRKSIQRLAGGAAGSMPNISKARLSTVEIIVPATSKQRSFVSAVKSVDAARSSMQTHLYNLDTLFASLQSRAFRGEL